MADSETQQPVDQQVTSKTPTTKQKNPNRVKAGKAVAERTRLAREAQKKALIEAQSVIAKKADPPSAEPPPVIEIPSHTITTTQWLSVISIIVSLVGLYYKRKEIQGVFTKKTSPVETPPPMPQAPPPVDARRTIRGMD